MWIILLSKDKFISFTEFIVKILLLQQEYRLQLKLLSKD